MPLLQLLHLLRGPHDAVRRPWSCEADNLPNHEGIKTGDNLPRALYSAAFRAGPSPKRRSHTQIQVELQSCVNVVPTHRQTSR